MPRSPALLRLRTFLAQEAASGIVLLIAALGAMILANLPSTRDAYDHLIHQTTGPVLAPRIGPMTIHLWINDGLMTLFFLVVGLEIKRELTEGRLATPAQRRLPVVAAIAGMGVPALVYLLAVGDRADLHRGWAIPAATDIAFALGVLTLLGSRAPPVLKLLLMTIAIVDDMGAVAIIAVAYTDAIDPVALTGAAVASAIAYVMNRQGQPRLWPYLCVGAMLWLFVLRSGVHATIAGVVLATLIPVSPDTAEASPLHRLEHSLHPWVAFGIMPLFAFANAGVAFDVGGAGGPLVPAIVAGLFLGKQAGVFAGIRVAVRFGMAPRPAGVSWTQVYGMSLLAGIGFTMSLFIGTLAFPGDPARIAEVKIGVLLGSVLSAIAGTIVLLVAKDPPPVTAR